MRLAELHECFGVWLAFFAMESGCGSLVVSTLISSNVDAVTRQEISISHLNASCALRSSMNASVSGSHSSSPAVVGVVYADCFDDVDFKQGDDLRVFFQIILQLII